MTIREALTEANNGNVQAMLLVADYYGRDMDKDGDFSVKELRLALKWYERAAQTGDAYALEMTGNIHTIFAETYLQMGEYEDSLKEWTQVYRYTAPLTQYPGYPRKKDRKYQKMYGKACTRRLIVMFCWNDMAMPLAYWKKCLWSPVQRK